MTTLPIPALARYLGQTVQFEQFISEEWCPMERALTTGLLVSLGSPNSFRNARSVLRRLSTLSDEECFEVFKVAFGFDATANRLYGINKEPDEVEVYSYRGASEDRFDIKLHESGYMAASGTYRSGGFFCPYWSPVLLTHYLESQGFDLGNYIESGVAVEKKG